MCVPTQQLHWISTGWRDQIAIGPFKKHVAAAQGMGRKKCVLHNTPPKCKTVSEQKSSPESRNDHEDPLVVGAVVSEKSPLLYAPISNRAKATFVLQDTIERRLWCHT